MTSSSRRNHRITAPTTRVATRRNVADLSRAILITVAIFAAIVGTLAHAAFGNDDPRPSSRRVVPKAETTEIQAGKNAGEVAAKPQAAEAFVVKSATTQSAFVVKQENTAASVFSTRTKRFVASSTAAESTAAVDTDDEAANGLKWRSPTRKHFQPASAQDHSAVMPAAYEEAATSPPIRQPRRPAWEIEPVSNAGGAMIGNSVVRQAQASRFTQGNEADDNATDDAPSLDPPTLPETVPPLNLDDPATSLPDETPSIDDEPPLTADDLLPPIDQEPKQFPETDIPRMEPGGPDGGLGALRGGAERSKPTCQEHYRNTDCCQQRRDCQAARDVIRPLAAFRLGDLDITPLYNPQLVQEGRGETAEREAQSKAQGLSIDAPHVWKNANGQPLGLRGGRVLGLDGSDWRRGGLGLDDPGFDVAVPLEGKLIPEKSSGNKITVQTLDGEEVELNLDQLSLDDQYWVNGRAWKNRSGQQVAVGRMVDFH